MEECNKKENLKKKQAGGEVHSSGDRYR